MVQRFIAYAYLPNFDFAWKGKSYGVGGKRKEYSFLYFAAAAGIQKLLIHCV